MPRPLLLLLLLRPARPCRWAAYLGAEPLNASDLLVAPPHALALQSHRPPFVPALNESTLYDARLAKRRDSKINKDGFGVGYFDPGVASATASRPLARASRSGEAVADAGGLPTALARQMAAAVASRVVFAHIRAGSGAKVEEYNAHPFVVATAPHVADPHVKHSRSLLFMHNGMVHDFETLKPKLLDHIGFERRQHIAGQTDSEHAGALLGHLLRQHELSDSDAPLPLPVLMDAVQQLVQHLDHLDADEDLSDIGGYPDLDGIAEAASPSGGGGGGEDCAAAHSLNFAVSDGFSLVATRFRSCLSQEPPSLYFGTGRFDAETGAIETGSGSILIASEPLSGAGEAAAGWQLVHKDE